MRQKISLTLLLAVLLSLCACGAVQNAEAGETWSFTDSCGRQVELPVEVGKIVPSGSLAQMILFTLCPDRLQSLSTPLTRVQKEYIDQRYWDLPVTGQFYGGGNTVNYEEIIAAAPDVIIDIGQSKETIAGDMDELQRRTGIPVIFIQADLPCMAEAYETLGRITGETGQAAACAAYIRSTLEDAAACAGQIPEDARKRVLYAQGEYGTEVLGAGSVHAEVLDYAAAQNVAVLSAVASEGGNEVSIEQIMLWDPEVVILSPDANYDEIFDDPAWAGVTAVRNGTVYEVPTGPYNWLDRPPSVQRVLGIRWLGNLLYPDVFRCDMAEETIAFYRLFFHCELTEEEAEGLMIHSTYREG
ncbi:MAG: ABC transporter substrate-binding protein [Clostridiales bacterium]|nr:ABC transporter substrate-binding protein [Clostridiales bacterium]MDY4181119.1 ABC transporter substrate-binding protein [Pseudoflavonifractor sp.]